MAAPVSSWRELLNRHKLCKKLKENNAKDSRQKQHNEAKNFLTLHGSDLFIWDSVDTAILHCNLRSLARNAAQSSESEGGENPSISSLCKSGNSAVGFDDDKQLDYQVCL